MRLLSVGTALTVVVWIGLAVCVYSISDDKFSQWDFNVYYSAARAFAAGKDPYVAIHPFPWLQPDRLFYLYPPVTLFLFKWATVLPLTSARVLWLGLKLVALAALVRLWHKEFERLGVSAPVALFLALGFNATLLRDFASGNISTFEQLGIWLGFCLLIRKHLYAAALMFACVAQFKWFPVAFIALLPMVEPREGWKPLVVGCVVFLALFALNPLLSPELFHNYLGLLADGRALADDRGVVNPSSLALFRDILDATSYAPGLPYNVSSGTLVYAIYLVALVLLVTRALWSNRARLSTADPRPVVYFGCALFVLAMPRLKDYSYILMLIPALFVVRDLGKRRLVPDYLLLGVTLMVWGQPQQSHVPGLQVSIYLLQAYLPLVLAGAILIYLSRLELPPCPEDPPHRQDAD